MCGPRFAFGSRRYWKHFYQRRDQATHFEWFVGDELASSLVTEVLQRRGMGPSTGCRVLHVGCGTSKLGGSLAAAGAVVTHVDYDATAVERARYFAEVASQTLGSQEWLVGDVRDLKRPEWSGAFDAVVDKGTMDALLFADRDERVGSAAEFGLEIARVLSPCGGIYVQLSDAAPEVRVDELAEALPASFQVVWSASENEEDGRELFVYVAHDPSPRVSTQLEERDCDAHDTRG